MSTAAVTVSLTVGELTLVVLSVGGLIVALLRYIFEHKYSALNSKYEELKHRLDIQDADMNQTLIDLTKSVVSLEKTYHELDKQMAVRIAKEGRE